MSRTAGETMFSEAIIPNPRRYNSPLDLTASRTVEAILRCSAEALHPPGTWVMHEQNYAQSLNPRQPHGNALRRVHFEWCFEE